MNKKKILVIGSVNMDLILQTDRIPLPSESYIGQAYTYLPGGKGANQAVAAARIGAEVSFLSRIGKDAHGESLKAGLVQEGIDTALVTVSESAPSGMAVILLEAEGQNRILIYPGANMELDEAAVRAAFTVDYDAVILQLEIPTAVVQAAVAEAAKRNIPVVLDAGPAKDFPLESVQGLTILSPNETETFAMCGIDVKTEADALKASKILLARSQAKWVVLKLGARGAYIYDGQAGQMAAPFAITAIDPTAAGDSFTAALTVRYLQCGDMLQAARYANAAGALAATRLGASASLPAAAEVDAFLAERV